MENNIFAFCHIVKAGGTTLESIFRGHFGLEHLDVFPPRNSSIYGAREIRRDFKYMPWIKSLSGHSLRPHIDYGKEFNERLIWFSWIREPVKRLISGYQHSTERRGNCLSFDKWLLQPNRKNRQIYYLTGSETDLDGAKEIVKNKMKFVGLLERFDESLILMKSRLDLKDLDIFYGKPANPAKKGEVAQQILKNIEKYEDVLNQVSGLDIELYNWFSKEVYPLYVDDYGRDLLTIDTKEYKEKNINAKKLKRISANRLLYRSLYRPILSKL